MGANEKQTLIDGIAALRRSVTALETTLDALSRTAPVYRHYKSKPGQIEGLYELICAGRMEADGTNVIVYRSLADDRTWVRPASEFYGKVPGSETTQRFTRVVGIGDGDTERRGNS